MWTYRPMAIRHVSPMIWASFIGACYVVHSTVRILAELIKLIRLKVIKLDDYVGPIG